MESTGEFVVVAREFSTRVQTRQDEFDTTHFFFGMNVDRHTPTIVADFDAAIFVESDFDQAGVTCKRFVDAVIQYFLHQMIGTGGVGIHARTTAHRIETGQYFNGTCVIFFGHGLLRVIPYKQLIEAAKLQNQRQYCGKVIEAMAATLFNHLAAARVQSGCEAIVEHFITGLHTQ